MLAELVWTGDDGWVWRVQGDAVLGSVDYSPAGQYAVFATNSEYGRPHHVTSYHADLGWRDLTRRERGRPTIGDIVAAIDDSGDVVAIRGAGSEDEPGYWIGGRLRVETYDDAAGDVDAAPHPELPGRRHRPEGHRRRRRALLGHAGRVALDRQAGRSRQPDRPADGEAQQPAIVDLSAVETPVVTATAAITGDGVGAASWQAVGRRPHRQVAVRDVDAGASPAVGARAAGPHHPHRRDGLRRHHGPGRQRQRPGRHRLGPPPTWGRPGVGRRARRSASGATAGWATRWTRPGGSRSVRRSPSPPARPRPAVTLGRLIADFYPAPETRFSVIASGAPARRLQPPRRAVRQGDVPSGPRR